MIDNKSVLNEKQEKAVKSKNPLFCLTASAGTGKTTVIVNRFMHLLEREKPEIENILALTFSRNAAAEMRERIKTRVEEKIAAGEMDTLSYWYYIYRKIDFARISTFHSFYADLLRSYPLEAGIDPEFKILGEDETDDEILLDIFKGVVIRLRKESNPAFLELMKNTEIHQLRKNYIFPLYRDRDKLHDLYNFESLNPDTPPVPTEGQIDGFLGNLPQAMMNDLKWSDVERRMKELRHSLSENQQLSIADGIIHRIDMILSTAESIRNDKDNLSPEAFIKTMFEATEKIKAHKSEDNSDLIMIVNQLLGEARDIVEEIEPLINKKNISLNGEMISFLKNILFVYKEFEESVNDYKRECSILDYTDLTLSARHLLYTNQTVLETVKANIKHILVDEFQDTDHIQLSILMKLTGITAPADNEDQTEKKPSRDKNSPTLFVVGDEKQSIYRFRGADVTVFNEIKRLFRNLDGGIDNLDINFRSSAEIITFHNYIFPQFLPKKEMFDFEAIYEAAIAQKPSNNRQSVEFLFKEPLKKEKKQKTDNTLKASEDFSYMIAEIDDSKMEGLRRWEAQQLAFKIKKIVTEKTVPVEDKNGKRDPRYSDIALLFNSMSNFAIYERVLIANNIPYRTLKSSDFLYRPEIMDIINLLWAIHQPYSDFNIASALRSPIFGINDETLLMLKPDKENRLWDNIRNETLKKNIDAEQRERLATAIEIIQELMESQDKYTLIDFISYCIDRSNLRQIYTGIIGHTERLSNIDLFINRDITSWINSGKDTLPELLNTIENKTASGFSVSKRTTENTVSNDSNSSGTVLISTIHGSKGMEYPIVFIPDMARKFHLRGSIFLDQNFGIALTFKKCNEENKFKDIKSHMFDCLDFLYKRKERAEIKRLLYVAATRAKDYIIFSGVNSSAEDQYLMQLISPFLPNGKFYSNLPCDLESIVQIQPVLLKTAGLKNQTQQGAFDHLNLNGVKVDTSYLNPVPISFKTKKRYIPSELPEYFFCRRRYYYKFVERMPEPNEEILSKGLPMSGKDFGSLVHRILQVYDGEYPEDDEFISLDLTSEQIRIVKKEVRRMLDKYRRTEIFSISSTAEKKLKERRFAFRLEEYIIEGAMDLVLIYDGKCHIIDFKTDKVEESEIVSRAGYYHPQISTYAIAASKLFENHDVICSLIFLNSGIVQTEKFDTRILRKTEESLLKTFRQIQSEKTWKRNTSSCPCEYLQICQSSDEI